jgi:hypothetical protein
MPAMSDPCLHMGVHLGVSGLAPRLGLVLRLGHGGGHAGFFGLADGLGLGSAFAWPG